MNKNKNQRVMNTKTSSTIIASTAIAAMIVLFASGPLVANNAFAGGHWGDHDHHHDHHHDYHRYHHHDHHRYHHECHFRHHHFCHFDRRW